MRAKRLLSNNIDLIDKDNDGLTSLLFACGYGQQDVVKFENHYKSLILQHYERSELRLFSIFSQKKININLIDKDNDGWTHFCFAYGYGQQDVVKQFLNYQISILMRLFWKFLNTVLSRVTSKVALAI